MPVRTPYTFPHAPIEFFREEPHPHETAPMDFAREADGTVTIEIEHPDGYGHASRFFSIPAEDWDAIVAHVSVT